MHGMHACVLFCNDTQFQRPLYIWVWFLVCMQTCAKINVLVNVGTKVILCIWALWRCLANNCRWESHAQESCLGESTLLGIQVPSKVRDALCPLLPAEIRILMNINKSVQHWLGTSLNILHNDSRRKLVWAVCLHPWDKTPASRALSLAQHIHWEYSLMWLPTWTPLPSPWHLERMGYSLLHRSLRSQGPQKKERGERRASSQDPWGRWTALNLRPRSSHWASQAGHK